MPHPTLRRLIDLAGPCVIGLALTLGPIHAAPVAADGCRVPAAQTQLRSDALRTVNQAREQAGLARLRPNPLLDRAAQEHACDMALSGRLSHTGSDGSQPPDRLRRAGYAFRTGAENVAVGFDSGAAVTAGWMASPGHRRNILDPAVTEAGFGLAIGVAGRISWVLDLADPR